MRCRLGLLSCSLALGLLTMTPATPAAGAAQTCAAGTTKTTSPSGATKVTNIPIGSKIVPGSAAGGTCWAEQAYPFVAEPAPGTTTPKILTVTSMAFRAWNRGLAAATETGPSAAHDPLGVWFFNGAEWSPTPGFPGSSRCPGHTIVWAGKKDYWLVGGAPWQSLCRFDGELLQWDEIPIPKATLEHVADYPGSDTYKPGGITSAACFAWNNCWFFGTYGVVVHWDGHVLTDASPELSQSSLQGEYLGAVAAQGPEGEPFGAAVAATAEERTAGPLEPNGLLPPAQLYGSSGGAFSPLAFTPPTTAQPGDPYRTDLVAVGFDSAGQGWVAGNPAGLRLEVNPNPDPEPPATRSFDPLNRPQPSPLVPISTSGAVTACAGPPSNRFAYFDEITKTEEPGAFLWSSIAVLPGNEALAGGRMRRATADEGHGPNEDAKVGEPVIARANCEGETTTTRFRVEDPTPAGSGFEAPADREGSVTAIAANAANDAWAATSKGSLTVPGEGTAGELGEQPPHLYRLTNGQPPEAPEGNDEEASHAELQLDAPIIVIEPPLPEPPEPPPAPVTKTNSVTLPAAVYDVKAKLHTAKVHGKLILSLYLTFKLHRPVTIGAHALRHGHVVSVAKPRHFAGHSGQLILVLNRKNWPTNVKFFT